MGKRSKAGCGARGSGNSGGSIDGALRTAKLEQKRVAEEAKWRQRLRKGRAEDDAIWCIEGVEAISGSRGMESVTVLEGEVSASIPSSTSASLNEYVQISHPDFSLPAETPSRVAFSYFGDRAIGSPATSELPQELLDKIAKHNLPTVLESYRRWGSDGYYLHILNGGDFDDTVTMLCLKPFHNETLHHIQRIVIGHVHISGLNIERVEAWGRSPAAIPGHITSRLHRIEFHEIQLLDFQSDVSHSIPAINELPGENDGKSAKHFNRISGIFERQSGNAGFFKIECISREMHSSCYIPELGAPQAVNEQIEGLLEWYGVIIMNELPSNVAFPNTGDEEEDKTIANSKRSQRMLDKSLRMSGGTLEELLDTYGIQSRGKVDWDVAGLGRMFEPSHEEIMEIAKALEGKGQRILDDRAI
ncbi:hypothetical protein DOTSEDRAFT_29678 [Dothistroma septosporum NZE10]|uniref:Uncharacterized protein n=1 Tax=Dothistroma septosporum (strain NZE10 / CBS 128990) TaxID=675120 RepID=M2XG84_DOTSN|nr:hypothetical protein DOTSEDRAFT_29678 [Dothistroma septosporum NZE10]